jgi:hypothetical protein
VNTASGREIAHPFEVLLFHPEVFHFATEFLLFFGRLILRNRESWVEDQQKYENFMAHGEYQTLQDLVSDIEAPV